MSAGNILYVFSSRRACNAFCAQQEDGFLPTIWSVSEFYSQVSYVPHLQKNPRGRAPSALNACDPGGARRGRFKRFRKLDRI
ncbi:hypothetical protein HBZS_120950 [Helicobacter bizzozeronii CCUG 35545]|nr:hypothetical protein HBZS_120950 [Helicobacter bizzozeronii CCUG 35545]